MRARRLIDTDKLSTGTQAAVTYQVSLDAEVLSAVRISFEQSGLTWPEWVQAAITRLQRESPEELQNLLADPKPASRLDKSNLPFRVFPSTLEAIKALAKEYDSTIQVVLSHAFFMQALASFE